MSSEREIQEALRAWMHDEEPLTADELIDRVAAQVPAIRQRSSSSWDLLRFATVATAAVAVVAVLIAVGALASGSRRVGSPTSTATPSSSDIARVLSSDLVALEPGTFTLAPGFPVRLTFDVPDGFNACVAARLEQGVCSQTENAGLSFVVVQNLVDDPCRGEAAPADPSVGRTVDDLVQGLNNLSGFTTTPRPSTIVDGRTAQALTLTATIDAQCGSEGGLTWIVSPTRTNGVASGEVNEIRILKVQGQRLMIAIAYQPDTPRSVVDAMHGILATVRFVR